MKKNINFTTIILYLIIISSLFLVACKTKNDLTKKETETAVESIQESSNNTDTSESKNENNDSIIPPVNKDESIVVSDSEAIKENSDNSSNKTDNSNVTFKDHKNTIEYIVPSDGKYAFSCEPSNDKAYWDIYILNEQFEDALKYLTSAYTPSLKVTSKVKSVNLLKGQYVYCICSENSLTDSGVTDDFTCPLSIKKQ